MNNSPAYVAGGGCFGIGTRFFGRGARLLSAAFVAGSMLIGAHANAQPNLYINMGVPQITGGRGCRVQRLSDRRPTRRP